MALTASEKREIAAMFEAFSERMTSGQQSRPVERFVYDYTTQQVIPAIGTQAQAFAGRPVIGVQRPEDILLERAVETALVPTRRKRAISGFQKAVSAGMKAAKKSKFYGKAGTLKDPKKAFAAVTKTVSRITKGGKAPKSGARRPVYMAAKKVVVKTMKKVRKGDKLMYQGNIGR